jgi:hypothetical protein
MTRAFDDIIILYMCVTSVSLILRMIDQWTNSKKMQEFCVFLYIGENVVGLGP